LIIHGEKDAYLGYDVYTTLQALPNHRHVVVRHAAHAVFQQRPDAFHAAVLAWLHALSSTTNTL
jgi:pimeloyl-ACP methyl ester carboxylesterase